MQAATAEHVAEEGIKHMTTNTYVRWFEDLSSGDVALVGGKNASLGEMVRALKQKGIRVPDGFATTSQAYWRFLEANHLTRKIEQHLAKLESGEETLEQAGKAIRRLFLHADFPEALAAAIRAGGSSISDYRDADGRPGWFQTRHRAYDREGQPCHRCRARIRRILVAGRSSHFCPRCQRAPRNG